MKIFQPLNTYFGQNIPPGKNASIVLSGGLNEPYFYSLGNQSTVPFIRLEGSGNTQKQFTWGETIEVLPGQNVQVQNASYHAGDIQIQSGRDVANKPSRITLEPEYGPPVPNQITGYVVDTIVTPTYPLDCRGAKRAYLGLNIETGLSTSNPGSLKFIGQNKQHSWPGDVSQFFTATPPTGKKYVWPYPLLPATIYTMIPMGFGAPYNPGPDVPMILTDQVSWEYTTGEAGSLFPIFFHVLEY